MSVRLQLEGQDLEGLLERVQSEYGARARIVEAEKLRSGGLGGFFAKESFAMTVELDEDGGVPGVTVPDDAGSLMGLVDAASRHEVSTSSEGFSDVLSRIARASGTAYEEFVAAPVPPAAPTRRPRPTLPPPRSLTEAPAPVIEAPAPAAAAVAPAPAAALPKPRPSSPRTAKAKPAKAKPAKAERAAPRRAEPAAARRSTPRAPSISARLRALGLPEHLVPTRTADLHRALVRALEALPTAAEPDLSPGSTVLLVGPAAAAVEAAQRLSSELDLDPAQVVLCAPTTSLGLVPARQRVNGPGRLASLVEAAARASRPLVVAVDERVATASSGARHGWATGVVALCPSATRWGVASATTKTSDVDRWTERVGGLDALWLEDVETSSDPATALTAGVPAARLDGRRATAAVWASLLCERLP